MKLAPRLPRRRDIAHILVIGCGLLAVAPAGWQQLDRWLADYQLNRLFAAADDDAQRCAEALAARGPTALPHLAEALTAPRARVAQAAQQALQREIATWDSLPPGEGNRRLRLLAKTLAARVEMLSPSARKLAMRQATRLLNQDGMHDGEVLRDCEIIMRGAAGSGSRSDEQVQSAMRLEADVSAVTRGNLARSSSDADIDPLVARSLALPGGSLPIPPRASMPLAAREIDHDVQPTEPSGAIVEPANRPDSSAMMPLRIAIGDGGFRAGSGAAEPLLQVRPKAAVTRASHTELESSAARIQQAGYASNSPSPVALPGDADDGVTLASMYQLHDDDPQIVAAAEAALAERGYGKRELELARRLTDADPEIRRSLAEILPGIGGIDTKLWLTWLSRDRVADVRLAALTVMATTGHATMLAHVQKVAGEDDDAHIRKLGEQLSQPAGNQRRSP